MSFLYFAYLSVFSFGLCVNPFMFQVKNANLTIQLLKGLDYGRKSESWKEDIFAKLGSWDVIFATDPLLFDNPVTNFLLLKMLRVDIQEEMIPKYLLYQFRRNVKVPTKKELRKSVILINDMMNMYGMQINKVRQFFNFSDSITMAEELFDEGLVKAAELWLNAAEDNHIQDIKDVDTSHRNFLNIRERISESKFDDDVEERFDKLCSNTKLTMNYETFKNASTWCRYGKDGKNPIVKMKIEELSQEPIVKIVHDFLTIGEVEELLKKSSNYNFEIAPIVDEDADADAYSRGRIAHSHYIDEERDNLGELTIKIKNRMSRISGINMDHSEDLEIVMYRPGGVHQPHVDQYQDEEELQRQSPIYGNRYAQGLLFLSKPKLGGNFAMPLLGISVVPKPGALVIWHNTDRNGNMDQRSYHGGCKVFVGHKIAGSTCAMYLDQDQAQCGVKERINQTMSNSQELCN